MTTIGTNRQPIPAERSVELPFFFISTFCDMYMYSVRNKLRIFSEGVRGQSISHAPPSFFFPFPSYFPSAAVLSKISFFSSRHAMRLIRRRERVTVVVVGGFRNKLQRRTVQNLHLLHAPTCIQVFRDVGALWSEDMLRYLALYISLLFYFWIEVVHRATKLCVAVLLPSCIVSAVMELYSRFSGWVLCWGLS